MNEAQTLCRRIGLAVGTHVTEYSRSYTKSGPGRRHNSKPAVKTIKQKKAGAFAAYCRAWCDNQNGLRGHKLV